MSRLSLAGSSRLGRLEPTFPVPPVAVAGLGLLVAIAVGALISEDARLGIGLFFVAVTVPLVLLNLPLGVAIWIPLTFIEATQLGNYASMGLLLLLSVAWLSVLSVRRREVAEIARRHSVMVWTLFLLIVWMTVSISWATDSERAFGDVWNSYVALAAFIVVATTITRPRHLVVVMVAIVVGAVLAALAGYTSSGGATSSEIQEGRLSGGLGDPNYLAAGIVIAMALGTGLCLSTRSTGMRWSLLAVLAFLGISLALTGSRGGLIAGAISVVAALVLAKGNRVQIIAFVLTAVTVAGIAIGTASPQSWDRFREFDTGGTGRVDLWDIAWRMSEDHPWVGVGVNNFRTESINYVRQPGSPEDIYLISEDPHVVHNLYLQQLAEIGIVGAVLFLAFIGLILRTSWTAIRRLEARNTARLADLGRSILIAQIGALVASFFLSNGTDQVLWILFALSVVLTTIAARIEQEAGIAS